MLSAVQVHEHYNAAIPPGRPSLTIQRAVIVSWPAYPPDYVLQFATNVAGPYSNYTGPIFTLGTYYIAPVPLGSMGMFPVFRLLAP